MAQNDRPQGKRQFIEDVVRQAGRYVLAGAEGARAVPETPPGTLHPTTDLDRSTDDLLFRLLMGGFSDGGPVAYLSEERADDIARLDARGVFIVYPIDGTRSLLKGLPEAAVSVALWRDGQLDLGFVFNPFTGEMFTAEKGSGASCNGAPMRVSEAADLGSACLVMSRTEHERGMLRRLEDEPGYTPMGSIAYKMALVAAGRHGGTFTPHLRHEWDIAGATVLVSEAGGKVTDARGNPVRFNQPDLALNGLVVSNGHLHDHLLELVNDVL